MNYWLVTTEFPPQSGGGISTYCWHTAKMLTQKNHEVTVFIPGNTPHKTTKSDTDKKIHLVYFPVEQFDHLGYEAGLSYTISQILKNHATAHGQPDVIEFQEYNGIGYYALQRKWLEEDYFNGTKFLVTAHAPGYLYLEYNQAPTHSFPEYWIGEMEKNCLQSADIVISPSQYLLDQLNLNPIDAHVIFNPFELKDPPKRSMQFGDIAFFGKLTPQKGALKMLEYFEEEWRTGEEYKLNVIGGGDHYFYPIMRDMGEHVREKYASRISSGLLNFEGHIDPQLLPERLSKIHIVIVPSIVDNLPYTVVEAMTMGIIVLASKDGGHRELIEHEKTGFLFDHSIDGDFFIQLKKILSLSNNEIEEIGDAAKRSITKKCGYDQVYDQKLALLNSLKIEKKNKYPFLRQQIPSLRNSEKDHIKGKVSIVVPFYNMGEYVEECIQSIRKNIYKNYEIIIVNDGSTDEKSLAKIKEFESIDNLFVFHKSNTGLSDTRNFGAKKATGEFIAFLDPDDYVDKHYYYKCISILERFDNISFVGCWAQYFGAKNYIWPAFNPEPPFLLTHNMINSSAIVIRRNDFLNFGLNDTNFIYGMEDYDSIINLVKNGCNGVVIPECLWYYRIRHGSMAQSFNKFSKQYLYRLLTNKHSEFYAQYSSEVINLLNTNGPGMNFDNPTKALGIFHGINLPFSNSKFIVAIKRNKFLRKIAKSIIRQINN